MHSAFFKDVKEAEESDEEDAGVGRSNVEGGESGGNPKELLISDEHRKRAPASDTVGPSAT